MLDYIKFLLSEHKITSVGAVPIAECETVYTHIMPNNAQTAFVFAVPYYTDCYNDGISVYAHVYDYHVFFDALFKSVIPKLKEKYPENDFSGFSDRSPINEKLAAAKAGLGTIGRNTIFSSYEYGSYVFLGEIITDACYDCHTVEITFCNDCRECEKACPTGALNNGVFDKALCLSAISQKKNITDEERNLLKRHGVVWGCDRCQKACKRNNNKAITPVPYFRDGCVYRFSAETLAFMDESEFSRFAFAYRGIEHIIGNFKTVFGE